MLPPWVGLHAVYTTNSNGMVETRMVSFMDMVDGNVLVRDSSATGGDGIMTIDRATRQILTCESPNQDFFLCGDVNNPDNVVFSEYWVDPDDLHLGAQISLEGFPAEVVGKTQVSVMGKQVPAWIVRGELQSPHRVDTWTFDAETGLMLGADFIGEFGWGTLMVSLALSDTNQALFGAASQDDEN